MKLKKLKRIISGIVMSLVMVASLVGYVAPVMAGGPVEYIIRTWDDTEKKIVETTGSADPGELIPVYDDTTNWTTGTYVVGTDRTIEDRVTVTGDVKLIIQDNATLTVRKGIDVSENNTLSIYSQADDKGTLVADTSTFTGSDTPAAIGSSSSESNCGTVNIYGGKIQATTGYNSAAAIGGARSRDEYSGDGGTINIYGGTVEATAGNGAGIGGGYNGDGGDTTIYGGTITATATGQGAGIGGGSYGDYGGKSGNITINGGFVTAITEDDMGAAIGGGGDGDAENITINGGTVVASNTRSHSYASAIGGGSCADGGNITINGGNVKASAQYSAIGCGTDGGGMATIVINGGEVEATATVPFLVEEYPDEVRGSLTINDGTVIANGCIAGKENDGDRSSMTINGGTLYANGSAEDAGWGGYAIGYDYEDEKYMKITANGGKVVAVGAEGYSAIPAEIVLGEGMAVYSGTEADPDTYADPDTDGTYDLTRYMTITEYSAPPEKYNLWVGGTQVTSTNKDDLTVVDGVSGDVVKYEGDNDSGTLTINNANIQPVNSFDGGGDFAGIYSDGIELTINVVGENNVCGEMFSDWGILVAHFDYYDGLSASGSLTIEGGGKLSVDSKYAIEVKSDEITIIDSTLLDLNAKLEAMDTDAEGLRIIDSDITAVGGIYGFFIKGDLDIINTDEGYTTRVEGKATGVQGEITSDGVAGIRADDGITYDGLAIVEPKDGTIDIASNGNDEYYTVYDFYTSEVALHAIITLEDTPPAEHKHDDITFTAIEELPTQAGDYYLTKDINVTETWQVPEGVTNLCLNGHKIIGKEGVSAIFIPEGSTLNLYDPETGGKLTHEGWSDIVEVNGGTFNMHSGEIGGIEANYAYAVKVRDGEFNMYGGTISDNKDHAVIVLPEGKMGISGNVVFKDNKSADIVINGTDEMQPLIKINGELTYKNPIKILKRDTTGPDGVRDTGGVFTENWSTYMATATPTSYFESFSPDYIVLHTTTTPKELMLYQGSIVTVTFDGNGGAGTMSPQTYIGEAPLDANTFTYAGYEFTGWNTKADGTGDAYSDKQGINPEKDMTLYAQWKKSEEPTTDPKTPNGKSEYGNALSINKKLKVTQTKKKISISWGAVKGADKYVVYGEYCSKFKYAKLKTLKGNKRKVVITKLHGKKLNLKKNYKFYIVAYKKVNGKMVKLGKSITAHIVGRKNSKYTNAKSITLKTKKLSLTVGKTAKVKAKTVLVHKKRKQLTDAHAKEFRYASSNRHIATVTKNGKVKGVMAGTCKIYVYSRNGLTKAVKVTVK